MPHLVIEYTDNLGDAADMGGLMSKAARIIAAQHTDAGPVFPVGGIRVRAIELTEYVVADGSADDAFVHLTFKVAAGRPPQGLRRATDELFAMVRDHFAVPFASRGLALSLELVEFGESGTYKQNNLHARHRPK